MTTARNLIKGSLRLLNVISANEEPTAEDVDISLTALNELMDSKSNDLLNIHTITPYKYLLEPGKFEYTLGPSGDWPTVRPMRIEQAKLMLNPYLVPIDQLWHFDTPSTTTTTSVQGSVLNMKPYGSPDEMSVLTTQKLFGAASLALGGGSDIPFPSSAVSANKTIDFSFWTPIGLNSGGILFDVNRDAGTAEMFVEWRVVDINTVTVHFIFDQTIEHIATVTGNVWTQFAIMFDSSNITVFKNGVPFGTTSRADASVSAPFSWAGNYRRGGYNYNYGDFVFVDELRIVSEALYSTSGYAPATKEFSATLGVSFDVNTLFLPLRQLADEEYSSIRLRGMSNQWPVVFYDGGQYPLRTITVWPVPQTVQAVEVWLWEPLQTFNSLDTELNLPQGYERYLRFKLAIELSAEFGKQVSPDVVKNSYEAEALLKGLNQQVPKMSGSSAADELTGKAQSWNYLTMISGSFITPRF